MVLDLFSCGYYLPSVSCLHIAQVPLPMWHLTSLDVVKKPEMQKLRKHFAWIVSFFPPVILVRLKEDDVEPWVELKGKGDIGRQNFCDTIFPSKE